MAFFCMRARLATDVALVGPSLVRQSPSKQSIGTIAQRRYSYQTISARFFVLFVLFVLFVVE